MRRYSSVVTPLAKVWSKWAYAHATVPSSRGRAAAGSHQKSGSERMVSTRKVVKQPMVTGAGAGAHMLTPGMRKASHTK